MSHPATQFTHAVSRRPGASVTAGLRAEDRGAPERARMQAAHDAYVATLRATGAEVIVLDALEEYPDALFVEDTALCLPEGAVMMRPGAASRMGEVAQMRPTLAGLFEDLRDIEGPGHIEGGDILFTGREVLVAARRALTPRAWRNCARHWTSGAIPCERCRPRRVCCISRPTVRSSTPKLSCPQNFWTPAAVLTATGCCTCPRARRQRANAIRFNDVVLVAAGFPRTIEMLVREGYDLRAIDNTDCALLDGGMSCLSLRINA